MRWPLLGLIVLLTLPPLVVDLARPGPQHNMEAIALLSARETWNRQSAGESGAGLLPTQNGAIRVRKPPMLVWLDLLAWTGLNAKSADAHELIWRARLVTVALGVLMLLATGWIGWTIERWMAEQSTDTTGDRPWLGPAAAMITGTMLLSQQFARLATYDMHLAAWGTLSVAASLAAIHQHAIWKWLLAAIALAFAWMSKGPLALVIFAIPVSIAFVMTPGRRGKSLAWLCVTLVGALTLIAPWYIYLKVQKPDAWATLWHEYEATLTNHQSWHYYPETLPRIALPWSLWMIVGLILPLLKVKCVPQRVAMFAALWLVVMVVAFSLAPGKAARYILPAAPVMALLAALAWMEIERAVRTNSLNLAGRALVIVHWLFVLAISLGFGTVVLAQPWLVERGVLRHIVIDESPGWAIASTLILTLIAVIGVIMQRRGRVRAALLATGIWSSAMMFIYWHVDANRPRLVDEVEMAAANVSDLADGGSLAYLRNAERDVPEYEFLFYLNRVVKPIRPKALYKGDTDQLGARFIMAEDDKANAALLQSAGFARVLTFSDGGGHERVLWRKP